MLATQQIGIAMIDRNAYWLVFGQKKALVLAFSMRDWKYQGWKKLDMQQCKEILSQQIFVSSLGHILID